MFSFYISFSSASCQTSFCFYRLVHDYFLCICQTVKCHEEDKMSQTSTRLRSHDGRRAMQRSGAALDSSYCFFSHRLHVETTGCLGRMLVMSRWCHGDVITTLICIELKTGIKVINKVAYFSHLSCHIFFIPNLGIIFFVCFFVLFFLVEQNFGHACFFVGHWGQLRLSIFKMWTCFLTLHACNSKYCEFSSHVIFFSFKNLVFSLLIQNTMGWVGIGGGGVVQIRTQRFLWFLKSNKKTKFYWEIFTIFLQLFIKFRH